MQSYSIFQPMVTRLLNFQKFKIIVLLEVCEGSFGGFMSLSFEKVSPSPIIVEAIRN